MSLLDRAHLEETVTVYPEETFTSRDGNPMSRASLTGITTRAVVQVAAASGTAGRRAEQDNEGFETEENYRIRFPRSFTTYLGPQSQVVWRGQRWSIVGEPKHYGGSRRTAHTDYSIRRA